MRFKICIRFYCYYTGTAQAIAVAVFSHNRAAVRSDVSRNIQCIYRPCSDTIAVAGVEPASVAFTAPCINGTRKRDIHTTGTVVSDQDAIAVACLSTDSGNISRKNDVTDSSVAGKDAAAGAAIISSLAAGGFHSNSIFYNKGVRSENTSTVKELACTDIQFAAFSNQCTGTGNFQDMGFAFIGTGVVAVCVNRITAGIFHRCSGADRVLSDQSDLKISLPADGSSTQHSVCLLHRHPDTGNVGIPEGQSRAIPLDVVIILAAACSNRSVRIGSGVNRTSRRAAESHSSHIDFVAILRHFTVEISAAGADNSVYIKGRTQYRFGGRCVSAILHGNILAGGRLDCHVTSQRKGAACGRDSDLTAADTGVFGTNSRISAGCNGDAAVGEEDFCGMNSRISTGCDGNAAASEADFVLQGINTGFCGNIYIAVVFKGNMTACVEDTSHSCMNCGIAAAEEHTAGSAQVNTGFFRCDIQSSAIDRKAEISQDTCRYLFLNLKSTVVDFELS